MFKKNTINFRKLTQYKYQLMEDYMHATSITLQQEYCIDDFVTLKKDGQLHIFKGYAWDGPSGPSIDTKDFMRGSLVHDALYQLMRKKQLPVSYKDYADKLLHDICIEDGMSKFRAWYVYRAVRLFGKGAIKPDDDSDNT